MAPLCIPIELEPSLQERNILKDKVDVNLISSPDQEVHWCLLVYRSEMLPDVVKAEELDSLLWYRLVEALQ